MKKNLIAGAGVVAALGVAALPVATFAADVAGSPYTETVKATIDSSCGAYTDDAGTTAAASKEVGTATLKNGGTATLQGQKVYLICNNTTGWTLSFVGGDGKTASSDLTSGTNKIASGASSEGTSYWNITFGGDKITFANTNPVVVKTEGQTVASTSAPSDKAAYFQPTYNFGASSTQAAGTYTGAVTYTLTQNN